MALPSHSVSSVFFMTSPERYGRIFKSLHILNYIDLDESYRRDIKGIRNLQEGRHALARKICHGKKDELYHRYERGLENQLGVLWLVLNCVVLWTTVYLDATVRQLRACRYAMRSGCSVATAEPSHKVKVDSDVSRWVLMR